ncbi:MAG: FAD-dependent oxidoreductase [Betaproteobacteria bacterium]|nr:FAD-dependent oxidoreductase [Betaproteobacteria bacterium]MDH5352022.1 FAD-dependent oxidoreductase [Betaproteobacteria bacterium]
MNALRARCCIAGGGPAGMMLGYLLARAGVDTLVLEKHSDFLRDFRGDTVHPSTLEVMHELGLLEAFLQRPHQKVTELGGQIGGRTVMIADFRHLPVRCGFVAFMPQWDFLDFLAQQARKLPAFRLQMQTEATQLIEEDGRVAGVRGHGPDGEFEVRAELTIAADGRHSVLRDAAGLQIEDFGAPMDVLWMKLSKRAHDAAAVLGRINAGRVFVTLDRGDYWQCAYVIPKGGYDEVRAAGLEALREGIGAVAPTLRERTSELRSWDDVKLLTVQVNRLRRWHRPGLLCIGDAAHAMSPIGGVGINLAIQDAVATANFLAQPLQRGAPTDGELAAVQRRRDFPTRMTQRMQLFLQANVLGRVLASGRTPGIAWPIRLMQRFPVLRRIPARLIGMGFRPEHVRG